MRGCRKDEDQSVSAGWRQLPRPSCISCIFRICLISYLFSGVASSWARAPWRLRNFFSLYVETSCLVWFGTMPNSNSALFVQPCLLWNDTITGYNGACAKVNVVFSARRYAL